jgi:hypothetical protein
MISDTCNLAMATAGSPAVSIYADGQLVVPAGISGHGDMRIQPVQDVRGYLLTRTPRPDFELERELFDRLPLMLRHEVRQLQSAMFYVRRLTTARPPLKVHPACARALLIYPQFSPLKTFRAKYDGWVMAKDWLVLVNRAKAGAEWQSGLRGLPDAFLDHVAAVMGDFKRGDAGEQAILSVYRHWRTGHDHRDVARPIPGYEAAWEERRRNLLPEGWNSTNIRKQLKRRAKLTRAVKALRHEGIASARAYLPQVHSTRGGEDPLAFMGIIQFDDVRCDFRVIDTVTGQICDLWLLVARDVATTMLLGFGMRPALARDDGSQEHLKLQDMKQLVGWLLETYGLPAWRMVLKMENGTATLAESVRAALTEMLGDRIDFSMGSMISGRSAAGYQEKSLGNSKAKAMLESLNRLQHMMASHFPGQIGAHYGKRPAELNDREAEAVQIWTSHRPEDRAELQYPVLTIPQAREKLFEVFRLQNTRTDHNCEGFEKIVEWYDAPRDQWLRTPPPAGAKVRARMESPMERAARLLSGCEPFTTVSPEIITAFYAHTQRRRPVEANGEISFTHEGKLLRFAPPAPQFALAPETKCLCYFNPDDPRFLTLTDGRGGILGTWTRRGLAHHFDSDAVAAAIRHSTSALNQAKARATELAAGENAQLQAMRDHNNGFVTVTAPVASGGRAPALSSTVASTLAINASEQREELKAKAKRAEELKQFDGGMDDLASMDDNQSAPPADDFSAEALL